MVPDIGSLLGFPFSKKAAQLLPLSLLGLQKRPTSQAITPFVESSGSFISCQLLDVSSYPFEVPFGLSNHSSHVVYALANERHRDVKRDLPDPLSLSLYLLHRLIICQRFANCICSYFHLGAGGADMQQRSP